MIDDGPIVRGEHRLDQSCVDEIDETSGDEQLSLVWCEAHQTYEWHWLERGR